LRTEYPTAVQAVAEVHETPPNELPSVLGAGGVDSTDQEVPSQRSTSARGSYPLGEVYPTAVQAVVDVHDTPLSTLTRSGRLGMVWIDQAVPFQRSAKAPWWLG
jgi:hypothetical protein